MKVVIDIETCSPESFKVEPVVREVYLSKSVWAWLKPRAQDVQEGVFGARATIDGISMIVSRLVRKDCLYKVMNDGRVELVEFEGLGSANG